MFYMEYILYGIVLHWIGYDLINLYCILLYWIRLCCIGFDSIDLNWIELGRIDFSWFFLFHPMIIFFFSHSSTIILILVFILVFFIFLYYFFLYDNQSPWWPAMVLATSACKNTFCFLLYFLLITFDLIFDYFSPLMWCFSFLLPSQ